jgi:hypothetical protein
MICRTSVLWWGGLTLSGGGGGVSMDKKIRIIKLKIASLPIFNVLAMKMR